MCLASYIVYQYNIYLLIFPFWKLHESCHLIVLYKYRFSQPIVKGSILSEQKLVFLCEVDNRIKMYSYKNSSCMQSLPVHVENETFPSMKSQRDL